MGQTAELLAERFDIAREAMDAYALGSHLRLGVPKIPGCWRATWRPCTTPTAAERLARRPPRAARPGMLARLAALGATRHLVARRLRRGLTRRANPAHYPAPFALLGLWARHGGDPARM